MTDQHDIKLISSGVLALGVQPHQLALSYADASALGVAPLDLVRVSTASGNHVLLECIVLHEHRISAAGQAILSPWLIHELGCVDNAGYAHAALTAVCQNRDQQRNCQWMLKLSVQSKYPLALQPTGKQVAAIDCLPESVRTRSIDLEAAVKRQILRMFGGRFSALHQYQLVPIQLLRETYVLRIEGISRFENTSDANDTLQDKGSMPTAKPLKDAVQLYVVGWSDADIEEAVASELAALSIESKDDDETFAMALAQRLEQQAFVGYDSLIRDVMLNLALILRDDGKQGQSGNWSVEQIGSHGLLLSGVHGVGKSLALRVLAKELERERISTWHVDAMTLHMDAENAKVATLFEYLVAQIQRVWPDYYQAETGSTSVGVILIDDIDVLFQANDGENSENDALPPLASALLRLMDHMSDGTRLCVVGTTSDADTKIPLAAKRSGRFGKVLEIAVPTEAMRHAILTRHLSALPIEQDADSESMQMLASRLTVLTGGYVAKDLARICRNALVNANKQTRSQSRSRADAHVTWEDLLTAQQQIKPSQLRELNVASPGGAHASVQQTAFAGYEQLQKQLFEFVSWKFHPTAAMNRLGIANASGVLVSGPSGCGKSLLVKTLAAQAQVNFVAVKSSELMSKYFGDSEKSIRQLFARARGASPCLLFFDEFDSIAHKRSFGAGGDGGNGTGVYARILSTFLNEMDGVGATSRGSSKKDKSEILVVAATNRIDALDAALIRPGRMDKCIEIGLPTTKDKEQILVQYTKNMPLAADVDIKALASRATGEHAFTGADLAAVCKEAAFRSLRQDIDATSVSMDHFIAAWDQQTRKSSANDK